MVEHRFIRRPCLMYRGMSRTSNASCRLSNYLCTLSWLPVLRIRRSTSRVLDAAEARKRCPFPSIFFQSMTTRLEVHETSSFALLYFHITIITPGGLLITWRHVLPRSTHLRLLSWRYLSSRLKSSGGTTTHGYRSGATLCVLDTSLVGKNGVLTKLETPSLRWQVGVDCCFSLC